MTTHDVNNPGTAEPARLFYDAVNGDVIALQALLHLHRPRLQAYIRVKLPSELQGAVDVEDVFQETCIRAFQHFRTFVPDGSDDAFARWLFTIARNYMIATLRKVLTVKRGGAGRRHDAAVAPDDDTGPVVALLDTLAVYHRTPSTSAAAHELAVVLEQSIGRLPVDWGQAIRLRHLEGLPVKDAAARMERTEGAFHQLCHRGLQQLRADLRSRSFYV